MWVEVINFAPLLLLMFIYIWITPLQLIKYNNYSTSCNDLLTISIWEIFVLRIFTNFCSIQFHHDRHFKTCGVFHGILLQNWMKISMRCFCQSLASNAIITIVLIMNFLRFVIVKGLSSNHSRSWKTCAIMMGRFWNPQESRWYAYRCMQENAQYHILPSWKMLNYSTWWTPHTLLSPWCFERFNYPKYTFTNPCTTTQCLTFTSNKHMKQYLCASNFEIIKATFQPRLWEFGKMVNMYIVSGGPSTYIDLTFCIWPSTLNNFTNAQYVKLGSFVLMLFEQTSWAHTKIKVHLDYNQFPWMMTTCGHNLIRLIFLSWFHLGKSNKTCALLGLSACFHNVKPLFEPLETLAISNDIKCFDSKSWIQHYGKLSTSYMHQYKKTSYQCWLTMVAARRNMGAMWILLFLEVWVVCFICWTLQYQIARNSMLGMVNLDQDYSFYVF
jgi:hypothetical protein